MVTISYLPIPALIALLTSTGLVSAADGKVTMEGSLQPPGQSAQLLGLGSTSSSSWTIEEI